MEKKSTRYEITWQVLGVIFCLAIVTAASSIWSSVHDLYPGAVLITYAVSFVLMVVLAFRIFRHVIRKDYEQNRQITPLSFFLQALIWGLFFAFACIFNPQDYAWAQSEISLNIPIFGYAGWSCVVIGLVLLVIALAQLRISRSCGQKVNKLQVSGLYGVSRNPQLMSGVLVVIGYFLLWPSLYALGWLLLYAIMTHLMVITEEEFLKMIFGEDFEEYCHQVPRYIRLYGKKWN